MKIARVVIAALGSGSGKTTVTTGLMGALSATGIRVQGFKVGPDFIDTSYHTAVTGRKSRNLDSWLLTDRRNIDLFVKNVSDCDIAIIEGVMGLFDGVGEKGSTAYMAKLLRAPVILVVDAWGMAQSAAVIIAGCKAIDKKLNLAGVILNRVSGDGHARICKNAIESLTSVPVIGYLPNDPSITLPERHLGLIPTVEQPSLHKQLTKIIELVKTRIDLNKVVEISKAAPRLDYEGRKKENKPQNIVSIGVAYDEAFNFYYHDALDLLAENGAKIRYFSPLRDRNIPHDIDGLYIGGGFPEMLAEKLESNQTMRKSIKDNAEEGMPILAECGGMMYLTKSIVDLNGRHHSMVGLLDGNTFMTRKLTLGYTHAIVVRDNILFKQGASLRGHEFHYSKIDDVAPDSSFAYKMLRGHGINEGQDGWIVNEVLAQYMHLHLAAQQYNVRNFIRACLRFRAR